MALKTGTNDIASLLAVTTQSVADYGVDSVAEVVARDLEVHNALMLDALGELAEISTDRQRLSGVSTTMDMVEVDEYGRGPTQKQGVPSPVAFPLRSFQVPLGWTEKWMQLHTPAELAALVQNAQKAHAIKVRREIQRALFLSANYSFTDFLVDKVPLAVKRLANADSAGIPDGPNGQAFDGSTHTHYLAVSGIAASNLKAAVATVQEHGFGGTVRIIISTTDEAAVSALTGFVPLQDVRVTLDASANQPIERLDITRTDNRKIGLFGSAEVWTKPWGLASYPFVYDQSAQGKPLVMRQRAQTALQGLRLAATISTFPLAAQYFEAEFGFGVWTRTNGAVLYTGGGSYTDPTIPQ